MTTQDIGEFLRRLAVLYPNEMKERESVTEWSAYLKSLPDFQLANETLSAFSRQSKYITIPEFNQFLENAKRRMRDEGALADDRRKKAAAAAMAARLRIESEQRAVTDRLAAARAMMAAMPNDRRERARQEALSRMTPEAANLLRTRSARSRALLLSVYEIAKLGAI